MLGSDNSVCSRATPTRATIAGAGTPGTPAAQDNAQAMFSVGGQADERT